MKVRMFLLLGLLLAGAGVAAIPPEYARVDGPVIRDGHGRELLLRGTNLGNWLNPEGYMFQLKRVSSYRLIDQVVRELVGPEEARRFWLEFRDRYITQKDIHYLKRCGFNHVRVPFNYKLFLSDEQPGLWLEEGFRRLDDVIAWCEAEELYVILDLHAAPGGQTGDNIDDSWGYPWLMTDEGAKQATVALWRRLAERYRDRKIILGYDLLNEPIAHFFPDKERLNAELEPLYKRLVAAIREVDPHHIIFLAGAQWNTNFAIFGPPFAPNLAYTFHGYWMTPDIKAIQPYLDLRSRYNAPIWLGESGENTDEWITQYRTLLEEHNIGWSFWPYKKMDSTRGIASFAKTAEWEEIIKFAEGPRGSFEEIRSHRPAPEVVRKALTDLLENIRFENCTFNAGYLKALGMP